MSNQESEVKAAPTPHLSAGAEVTFVDGDGKSHKGKIDVLYNEREARVAWENGSGIGAYSEKKGPSTFHLEQASPKTEHHKEAK